MLLQKGANAWLQDHLGCTALHHAARNDQVACLQAILACDQTSVAMARPSGLPPRARLVDVADRAGYTPLHHAMAATSTGCLTALLGAGANMLARSSAASDTSHEAWVDARAGSTLLHVAARSNCLAGAKLVLRHYMEELSERHVDPRGVADAGGILPYQLADYLGHRTLAWMLSPWVPLPTVVARQQQARTDCPVPKLSVLASLALQRSLMHQISRLEAASASGAPQPPSLSAQQDERQLSLILREQEAAEKARMAGKLPAAAGGPGTAEEPQQPSQQQQGGQLLLRPASGEVGGPSEAAAGAAATEQQYPQQRQQQQNAGQAVAWPLPAGQAASTAAGASIPAAPTTATAAEPQRPSAAGAGAAGGLGRRDSLDGLCSICFEREAKLCAMPCKHAMCGRCLRAVCHMHIAAPPTCPYCRTKVTGFDLVALPLPSAGAPT